MCKEGKKVLKIANSAIIHFTITSTHDQVESSLAAIPCICDINFHTSQVFHSIAYLTFYILLHFMHFLRRFKEKLLLLLIIYFLQTVLCSTFCKENASFSQCFASCESEK